MPSTDRPNEMNVDVDFIEIPAGMYEYLTGRSITEPMLDGFSVHHHGDVTTVQWHRRTPPEPPAAIPGEVPLW